MVHLRFYLHLVAASHPQASSSALPPTLLPSNPTFWGSSVFLLLLLEDRVGLNHCLVPRVADAGINVVSRFL